MLRKLLFKGEDGDTLIEVLVVLAVLGFAIGISYATASQSLLNARQAQENTQATEYSQTELEFLRVLGPSGNITGGNPTTNIYAQTSPFCIYSTSAVPPITNSCTNFDPSGIYLVNIYYCAKISTSPPACTGITDPYTFIIQTTWPDVSGKGTDSVTLSYKTYPTT